MKTIININLKNGDSIRLAFVESIVAGIQFLTVVFRNESIYKCEMMFDLSVIKSIDFEVEENGN